MNKVLKGITFVIWELGFLWTLFLMLGKQAIWKVYTAKEFTTENAGYLMVGLLLVGILFFLNRKYGKQIEEFLKKYGRILLYVSLAILLIWNLYACYGGYFISGWDAAVIHDTAFHEFYQEYDQIHNLYFSWCPNNKLIVWIFTGVLKIADAFGLQELDYALVIFQIILGVLTMWLVYVITFHMTHNYRISWMAYSIAYLFVGLSPWYIVAYSDATGIILPILMVRMYQKADKTENSIQKVLWWILIGFIAMAGYYIKPQTVIAFIAIVLVEAFVLLHKLNFKKVKTFVSRIGLGIAGMLLCMFIYNNAIVPSLHFQIDYDKTIGFQHYLMMGLSSRTDGVYDDDDFCFTKSFATNEERNAADIEMVKYRVREYGMKNLIKHLCRKQLVNYNDGTLAWGVEGGFFSGDPEWAQNGVSDFVRSYIKPEGANYNKFLSSKQLIWIMVIFFQLFVIFYKQKNTSDIADRTTVIMMMSVIGLTLFELLFEARARYLICYAPIYVILAVLGMRNVFQWIGEHVVFDGKVHKEEIE